MIKVNRRLFGCLAEAVFVASLVSMCTNPVTKTTSDDEEVIRNILDTMAVSHYGLQYVPISDVSIIESDLIVEVDFSKFTIPFFPFELEKMSNLRTIKFRGSRNYILDDFSNRPPLFLHAEFYDATPLDTFDAGCFVDSVYLQVNQKKVAYSDSNSDRTRFFVPDEDGILLPRSQFRPQSGTKPLIVEFPINPSDWKFEDGSNLSSLTEVQSISIVYNIAGNVKVFVAADDQTPSHLDSIMNYQTGRFEYNDDTTSVLNMYKRGAKVRNGIYPTYFGAWVDSQLTTATKAELDSFYTNRTHSFEVKYYKAERQFRRPSGFAFSRYFTTN